MPQVLLFCLLSDSAHTASSFTIAVFTSFRRFQSGIGYGRGGTVFLYIMGVKNVGLPRKIKNPKQMEELWESYKEHCDNQMVLVHDFSSKNSEFVSKELRKSITYTVEGFCVFIHISRSQFYRTYAADERFTHIVTRIKEECEVDARSKFELGIIPPQLAALWMSKHGYSTKTEQKVDATMQTEQNKLDDLLAQISEDNE